MKRNTLCVKQFPWNNLGQGREIGKLKKFIIKISERGDMPRFSALKGGAPYPSGAICQRVFVALRGYGLNIAVLLQ
uniref:Uncharacterized protein n=1 Tax=Dulem virus 40 TaxID=3145758 RepID=A0AAU8AUY6_9CAUD